MTTPNAGTDAGAANGGQQPPANLNTQDLELVDEHLEDAHKSDEELFNELEAEERTAAGGSADADTAAAPPKEGAAADEGADDAAAAAAAQGSEGEESSTDEGAARAPATPKGDEGKGAGQPDKGKPDIWANATPEQRAAIDAAQAQIAKLEHAEKSARGRLSSLTRTLDTIRSKPAAKPAANGGAAGAAAKGVTESDAWKAFAKDYPEVAGPIGQALAGMQLSIADQGKVVQAITEDALEADREAVYEALDREHSDWETVTADPAQFKAWLDTQPEYVQAAAKRNSDEIVNAKDAADIIGRYKAFRSSQDGGNAPANGPSGGGGGNAPANGGKTGSLSAKRNLQLESASGARSGGRGTATGIPDTDDEQVLWDAMEREDQEKERRRRA